MDTGSGSRVPSGGLMGLGWAPESACVARAPHGLQVETIIWAPPFEKQFLKAVPSVRKHLVSTYCVPGTVEGPGDPSGDKTEMVPALADSMSLQRACCKLAPTNIVCLNE